jgi:hypothetical protein
LPGGRVPLMYPLGGATIELDIMKKTESVYIVFSTRKSNVTTPAMRPAGARGVNTRGDEECIDGRRCHQSHINAHVVPHLET